MKHPAVKPRGVRRLSLAAALAVLICCALPSCAERETPLLELEGQRVSARAYGFLLSRARGNLEGAGFPVDDPDFWDTVASSDGQTYGDRVRASALDDARRTLASLVLFDREGLSLPKSERDRVREEMDGHIRDAGSKTALNRLLAPFGFNADLLREQYLVEAKCRLLRAHLYGADGEKIGAEVRREFLSSHAVCFRQLLIRSFSYVYETDANGDEIYYQAEGGGSGVAYDRAAGDPREGADGRAVTDRNGDVVYFLPGGRIAYDRAAGFRAVARDESGHAATRPYPPETLAAHERAAAELVASVGRGDFAAFEARLAAYGAGRDEAFVTDGAYCFLYTAGGNGSPALDDLAASLSSAEEGEVLSVRSEHGFNVVMRYPIPEDAAVNPAYAEWFSPAPSLTDRVAEWLFRRKCAPLIERAVLNGEALATVPPMAEIGTNRLY